MNVRVASSALVVGLLGCGSPQAVPGAPQTVDAGATIAAARALWAERKQTCEAYYYDRAVTGMFGTGVLTVQIVNDQPQWRWYIGVDLTSATKMPVDWIEDMAMLGTHPDAPAASTVEQLWDQCAALLAMKNVFLEQPLSVNEDGVPMSCSPIVENCEPSMSPGIPTPSPDCQPQIVLQGFSCGTLALPQRGDGGLGDGALDAGTDAGASTDAGARTDADASTDADAGAG